MGCKCNVVEILLGIAIIVFALWETAASQWIVIVAAVLLILHALACKSCKGCCGTCDMKSMPAKRSAPKRSSARKPARKRSSSRRRR